MTSMIPMIPALRYGILTGDHHSDVNDVNDDQCTTSIIMALLIMTSNDHDPTQIWDPHWLSSL